MAKLEDTLKNNQDMQREIARKQQQIIQRYQKRLNQKKMLELQTFIESGKQVGSSHFLKLSPVVQEVVLKLNLSGIEIMSKSTKNPLRKVQFALSKAMMKKLETASKSKKKGTKKGKTPKKGFSWNPITITSAVISAGALIWLSISLVTKEPEQATPAEVVTPKVNVTPTATEGDFTPAQDSVIDTPQSEKENAEDEL